MRRHGERARKMPTAQAKSVMQFWGRVVFETLYTPGTGTQLMPRDVLMVAEEQKQEDAVQDGAKLIE